MIGFGETCEDLSCFFFKVIYSLIFRSVGLSHFALYTITNDNFDFLLITDKSFVCTEWRDQLRPPSSTSPGAAGYTDETTAGHGAVQDRRPHCTSLCKSHSGADPDNKLL